MPKVGPPHIKQWIGLCHGMDGYVCLPPEVDWNMPDICCLQGQYHDLIQPKAIQPFLERIINVRGDGHCGYRAVARALCYSDLTGYHQVRQNLYDELQVHKDIYKEILGKDFAFYERNIRCLEDKATKNQWMVMPAMGHIMANKYARPVHYYSGGSSPSSTFLPFFTFDPSNPPIILALVKQHFLTLRFKTSTYPIPPVNPFWHKYVKPPGKAWQAHLKPLLDEWSKHCI